MTEQKIIQGDCLEVMKKLPDGSVDAVICDPPYELGFMGKAWDSTGIANNIEVWKEALRVLKPGGYLLAFSGTRTYHRMACAIEDAGFEVRDMIEWVYGSGFPKSLNIGKAVDKLKGNEREIVGGYEIGGMSPDRENFGANDRTGGQGMGFRPGEIKITKGTSEWEGWGTALKPAHEPICMARKPLAEKTVAENVLKYGAGGINIDESRVGTTGARNNGNSQGTVGSNSIGVYGKAIKQDYNMGRFPANLIHDNSEEVRECFPDVKGEVGRIGRKSGGNYEASSYKVGVVTETGLKDNGNASRFFKSIIYQAKTSKSERNKGCEELEEKQYSHDGRDKEIKNPYQRNKSVSTNNHPTVKPVALMEYLIRMTTREGQTILDPFAGSGTTGVACKNLNRACILIEKEEAYVKIAQQRLDSTPTPMF
ncbi:MAG: DNA methyltransferase [Candidatus Paceibacterota bacterium]|jgi:site-specific DNA-methyltransferase (adenine-specific)